MKRLIYSIFLLTSCFQTVFSQTQEEVLERLEDVIREYTKINNPGDLAYLKVNPDSIVYAYVEDLGNMRNVESTYIDLKDANWSVDEDYNLMADRPAVLSLDVMQDSNDSYIYLPTSKDSLNSSNQYGFRCDCNEIHPYLAALFTWLKQSSEDPDVTPSVDLQAALIKKFEIVNEKAKRYESMKQAEMFFDRYGRAALASFLPLSRFSSFKILGFSLVTNDDIYPFLTEVLEEKNEKRFGFPLALDRETVKKADQQLLYLLEKFLGDGFLESGVEFLFDKSASQFAERTPKSPGSNRVFARFTFSNLLFEVDYSDYKKVSERAMLNDATGGIILFSPDEDWLVLRFPSSPSLP